jgi:hypothetical protein
VGSIVENNLSKNLKKITETGVYEATLKADDIS